MRGLGGIVPGLVLKAGLRHLGRRPWLALLPLFGVALGVALVLAVDLANRAALDALARSVESVSGRASHRIVGGADELPESLWGQLAREVPGIELAPLIERDVLLSDHPGEVLRAVGLDPLSAGRFGGAAGALIAPQEAGQGDPEAWTGLLARSDTCLLTRASAERLGLELGQRLALRIGSERVELELIGHLDPDRLGGAGDGLLVLDIAAAQERLGTLGRLTRLDLIAPAGAAGEAALSAVAERLPPDARLEPVAARSGQLARLTRAFRQNLYALAGLSLFVGAFLITNAVRLSVVERRGLLRRLVQLGATRSQVLAGLLCETLCLGALGAGLGLLLGRGLAELLYGRVRQTIQDLYTPLIAPGEAAFGPAAGLAFGLGLGAALLAALPPALEGAREASREQAARSGLEQRAERGARRSLWLALLGLASSGLLLALDTRRLEVTYGALILLLLALALLVPPGTRWLLGLFARPFAALFGSPGRLAIDAARRSLSRTALAVAALMIALASTLSVSVLIGSFRSSLELWLEATLVADIYAAPPALAALRGARGNLEADLARRLSSAPGIAGAMYVRQVFTPSELGEIELMAIDFGTGRRPAYYFLAGDPERAWAEFEAGRGLFVSEPLAFRHGLEVGRALELTTPRGPVQLPILAVLRDYGSERGLCWLERDAYVSLYRDGALSSLALWLDPGLDPERELERLRGELRAGQELFLRSNRGLRQESLRIFDRTFAVTALLRVLTLAVALVGTLTALLALALDRAREVALLRALGLEPAQLLGHLALFGAALGLAAGLFAAPVGALLAALMMGVVNRDSFGWTMLVWRFPPGEFALALGLALAFAAGAAVCSAPRLMRAGLSRDLTQE